MQAQISQIVEFHENFELPVLRSPAIPPPDRVALRVTLLEEELAELREALEQKDAAAALKEWCDVLYVLLGAAAEFGFLASPSGQVGTASIAELAFSEVHRSNMSKVLPNLEDAIRDAPKVSNRLERGKGWGVEVWPVRSGFVLRRTPDLKILKPTTYSPRQRR